MGLENIGDQPSEYTDFSRQADKQVPTGFYGASASELPLTVSSHDPNGDAPAFTAARAFDDTLPVYDMAGTPQEDDNTDSEGAGGGGLFGRHQWDGGSDVPPEPPDGPREAGPSPEEPEQPFGVGRFEGRIPTAEHRAQAQELFTSSRAIAEMLYPEYVDREIIPSDRSGRQADIEIVTRIGLQHDTPQGAAAIMIDNEGISAAFTSLDGTTTYNQYYDDNGVIRKDTRDPTDSEDHILRPGEVPAGIFWAAQAEEVRGRQADRRTLQEMGVVDPAITPDELQVVFEHIIGAEPAPQTYINLYNTVRNQSKNQLPVTRSEAAQGADELGVLVNDYVQSHFDAEQTQEGTPITSAYGTDTDNMTISVGYLPDAQTGVQTPFVRVTCNMIAEGADLQFALQERGLPPDATPYGSYHETITFGTAGGLLLCNFDSKLFDGHNAEVAPTPDSGFSTITSFASDAVATRILRNFIRVPIPRLS